MKQHSTRRISLQVKMHNSFKFYRDVTNLIIYVENYNDKNVFQILEQIFIDVKNQNVCYCSELR